MRLCSLNVHVWSDASGRSNVDRVIEFLRGLACDVIALQEVMADDSQLARVVEALGMHHAFAASSWLGNALLSPHPLAAIESVDITANREEGRCAVLATAVTPEGSLDVASTHLDAWDERTRVAEVDRLVAALARRDPARAVLGDFNALRLSDYPPSVLAAVTEKRLTHGREAPCGDVIAAMDRAGYVDLVRRAQVPDDRAYAAALDRPLPSPLRSTCWVGTRIDYVWGTPALLARFAPAGARVVETAASDHAAVVVDLAPAAATVIAPR